jgi:hypothetical protein
MQLMRYRKHRSFPKPRSPGKARWEVQEIRDWIAVRKSAHNFGQNGDVSYPLNEREEALLKKTLIEIERERFKLDVERGKYELKSLVTEAILRNVGTLFRELDKAFKHELPPRTEGCSAAEIAKLNGQMLDAARERLVQKFQNQIAMNS